MLTALVVVTSSCGTARSHAAPVISLVAAGDVMLDRGVAKRIQANGLDWPFEKVAPVIRSADLAFCNLECPLSADGQKIHKPVCFKANPAYAKGVAGAGFDVVSIANNHSLDCGREGLVETIRALDRAGIAHGGGGKDLESASAPVIKDIGGVRVAFLVRNMVFPEAVWYRTDVPTIAGMDQSKIEDEIHAAKSKADVVIVSVHWGVEYRQHPEDWQKVLAHRMIDAGASLVLGHHPHTVQPVERYHGGVIAYSLGNFVFDSRNPKCKDSMILKCRLSKSGVSDVELIPGRIEHCRPEPL